MKQENSTTPRVVHSALQSIVVFLGVVFTIGVGKVPQKFPTDDKIFVHSKSLHKNVMMMMFFPTFIFGCQKKKTPNVHLNACLRRLSTM